MKVLVSTFGLFFLVSAAFAQTDRGTITGTVLDPTGAVVANASIEAKNAATNETYKAGATGTGNYTLSNLPAGSYELTISAAGFKKYVRPSLAVQVAATVRADATLEVGETSDTVTVNAEAALLKTESGELSHQIDYKEANDLPLFTLNGSGNEGIGNIRDPLSVLSTMPGASFASDYEIRVNGLPSGSQAIRVEGQDSTNGVQQTNSQAVQQSVDAIQEVSVQTSNFAAEYGQVGGGYINFTMKSGTNQLHGSAYEYFQNTALNSGVPFTVNAAGTGHIKNPLNRNDYGFTLGGPVRIPKVYNGKDKTFFFFNFEQFRQSVTTDNLIATAPLPAWTAGSSGGDANFSNILGAPFGPAGGGALSPTGSTDLTGQIFDPTTSKYVNGGANGSGYVETPFPNNTIPYSRMDPSSLAYQKFFIAPSTAGLANNSLQPAFSNYRHTTIPSFKIDQNVSSKIKLSGYYSATRTYSPNANGYTNLEEPATPQVQNSQTIRVNYDQTITPTLLLHLGAGLLYFDSPQYPPSVNAGQLLGWAPNQQYPANNFLPNLGGLSSFFDGGLAVGGLFGGPGVGFANDQDEKEIKTTANANMTWVKGNHTFKWGGETAIEGFPTQSSSRANALYGFSGNETANPWEFTSTAPLLGASNVAVFGSGFPYASFLLGSVDSLNASAITDTRMGKHALGFFVQDNWKVTHKLTLEYGLRWDFSTLLLEEHGRMQSACFQCPNPNLIPADSSTPLNGLVVYQKQFNQNYPFAFGPRIGAAYQLDSKTVFRAGGGIAYATAGGNAGLSGTDADFYGTLAPEGTGQTIGGAPGQPNGGPGAIYFRNGNPFAPGNAYGNGPLTAPLNGAAFPSQTSSSGCGAAPLFPTPCKPIDSPFITIDKGTGRPPRIFQWSLGLQREVIPNLLIEASYVGNRGAWFTSPILDPEAENGLTPAGLLANRSYGNTTGLNVNNPAQLALLTSPISSPAVIAAYPALANPNNVYPGFPSYEPLNQALRPVPQWVGVPPFLGPPLGDTWYDSLQVKLTKRYSRGLTVNASYTFQKELTLGANSATPYFTAGSGGEAPGAAGPVVVNDVNNRMQNKQISSLDHPQVLTVTFNYTTPRNKFGGDGVGGKTLQWLSRDWTFGGVLRYQSGQLLETPSANNNFLYQLGVGSQDNPALFSSPQGLENYVAGQSFFAPGFNPNSHFDPTKTLVLNPNAWTQPGPAQFGVSAPYYISNRWQRQPAESFSLARNFRIKEKYNIQIRAEFQNIFNRVFYTAPATGNGTGTATGTTYNNPFPVAGSSSGALNAGYGYVDSFNGYGTQPRTGQVVARFTF